MKFSTHLLPFFLALVPSSFAASPGDLQAQIGHHVIFSYPGLKPPAHLLNLIKEGKVGGIILFGENVDDSLTTTIDNFQEIYKQSPYYSGSPLFIMTDQEGGKVRRLAGGPEESAKQIGQAADPEAAATQMGKDAASTLEKFKNNVNLAPVLDVYREAGDFADSFERSFSNSSRVVGTCGSAFISAQQSTNIIASAKHFPGLGAAHAGENTDMQPVTIDLTVEELRKVDMAPYREAIAAGVDMVMTSWAIYPALDPTYPSGLSKTIIQNELRGRLGFKGVTITDAIEAGSLEAFGDQATRGLLAAQAGVDLLLAAKRDVTQGEDIYNALLAAVQDGSLDEAAFAAATQRILEVRKKLVLV
ncbi:Glycoside hydrolase superfamily [Penicillium cf. griseofulvum]|uniref:Glycoside hydrolase superfamily n=1 Tax=Penicillium cf. griseofulvum TaxID=2972120 RepID=A0A9W9T569_9EURO|nr:Glycoside hydrolase superfamily [Penicillium cf. griseofulvum]KAJ5421308.1 Glycoside hydrolase superfamily [Penicillium cf. griseofulvum]KAJ5424543.1 Glycoside hydrolase superfamily [Penicillium cf. griseofulvum]